MLREKYYITKIDYATAMQLVIEKHYLHRRAPCSHAFGLFQKHECPLLEKLVGVITYGVSCSSTLLKGICGPEEAKNVYELTRLWVDDSVGRNAESFLIGNTIKLLDREIIVSFSEIQQGHVGTVYQAANFYYCGLSTKFSDPKIKGLEHQHHGTYANGLSKKQILEKYGEDNVYYVDRPRKHRYVYFNANPKRKKELLNKLRYKILSYPKKDCFSI